MRIVNLKIKRIIDVVGSLVGMGVLSPFIFIIFLIIKTTSKGPVFFKQDRLGENGKIFKIIKFRTMIVNAENIGSGLFVRTETDDRITKIGKILRSTSLDELPQLWNVFIGDMSLVGPRPPVPHHPYRFEDYSEVQKMRFLMKPGMTGLTQVTVRNSVSWNERIPIDVKYVQDFNIWLDIIILVKTLQKILNNESIYTHSNRRT